MTTDVQTPALRVLVVSQYGRQATGGAERYIHEVCGRLHSRHGFNVIQAATDMNEAGGLSPVRYPLWSAGLNPSWGRELRALITAEQPDVMYVHHTVPGVTDVALRVARQLRLPAEVMYHSDVTGMDLPRRVVGCVYQRLVGAGSLAAARAIHVASQAYLNASPVLRGARRPVVEAPPGVDGQMSSGAPQPHAPFLLFVGKADVPSKGFAVLLEAWQRLRQQRPELELVMIGSGTAVGDVPGLHWVGPVGSRSELANWFASALVTVLPSTSSAESFGMVLAEALVAGSPVVASRIGGLPALVSEGQTGYLAEPGNARSLEQALGLALTHNARLRATVASQRGHLTRRFSWDRTAEIVAASLATTPHVAQA